MSGGAMREPQRLLSRLNAITVDWNNVGCVTGDVLRSEDIAACLAGLPRGPYLLLLYLWSGDKLAYDELLQHIFYEAQDIAEQHNWRCKSEPQRLFAMIKMALQELMVIKNCRACKGSGLKLTEPCKQCYGTGKRRISNAEYASRCGVKASNWVKCWEYKYKLIFSHITEWESIGMEHLLSKL